MLPLEIENIIKDYIMDLNILEKQKNVNKEIFNYKKNIYYRYFDGNLSISNLNTGNIFEIKYYSSLNITIIRKLNYF